MKQIIVSGVALAAISATAPVFAADLRTPAPTLKAAPVVAPMTWSGCYAGLHGGYGWGESNQTTTGRQLDPAGYFAGGQLGCNWQYQTHWLWGVEADLAGANISETRAFTGGGAPTVEHKIDWLASIRARAGWTNGPSLWYVTGGWGWAGADRFTRLGGGASGTSSETHQGWVLGAGYEHMINNNWTVKLEYVYYDLGAENYNYNFGVSPVNVDLSVHTVKFGVNFKW